VSYGHAERTLAAIRRLETETAALLNGLKQRDQEEERWLHDTEIFPPARFQARCPPPRPASSPQWEPGLLAGHQ
jgi:hypothetical protein